jgi:hypothetical protein
MNKDIELYSNPTIVLNKAKQLFGENIEIYLSTRKDKKYMIRFPNQRKFIHFGQYGYEDFTKHKDKDRRQLFENRNKKWADREVDSPAFLAFHLLWT